MNLGDALTAAAKAASRRQRLARLARHRRALRDLVQATEDALAFYTQAEIDEQPVLCNLRRAATHGGKVLVTDTLNTTQL